MMGSVEKYLTLYSFSGIKTKKPLVLLFIALLYFNAFYPFYDYEEFVNNNPLIILPISGVFNVNDFEKLEGIQGTFTTVGFSLKTVLINDNSNMIMLNVSESGVFLINRFLVKGEISTDRGGVFVSDNGGFSIGEEIVVSGTNYTVLGVFSKKLLSFLRVPMSNNYILIFKNVKDFTYFNIFLVWFDPLFNVVEIKNKIVKALRNNAFIDINFVQGSSYIKSVVNLTFLFLGVIILSSLFVYAYWREISTLIGLGWKPKFVFIVLLIRYIFYLLATVSITLISIFLIFKVWMRYNLFLGLLFYLSFLAYTVLGILIIYVFSNFIILKKFVEVLTE